MPGAAEGGELSMRGHLVTLLKVGLIAALVFFAQVNNGYSACSFVLILRS